MSEVKLYSFLLPPAAQLQKSRNVFVLTMHENITLFSIVLRWFVAFSSPDCQRMKSFDGQNRSSISSHTNVSEAFSLFLPNSSCGTCTLCLQKHNVHQKKLSVCASAFDSIFQHQSIFLSPILSYVTNSVPNESYYFLWPLLDQSNTSTDPLKGHISPTGCVTSDWSRKGTYKWHPREKWTLSVSNTLTVQSEIKQDTYLFDAACVSFVLHHQCEKGQIISRTLLLMDLNVTEWTSANRRWL